MRSDDYDASKAPREDVEKLREALLFYFFFNGDDKNCGKIWRSL